MSYFIRIASNDLHVKLNPYAHPRILSYKIFNYFKL